MVKLKLDARRAAGLRWPVASGIPLPPGHVGESQHIVLHAPDGRRVPVQVEHSVPWPDCSTRWLLVEAIPDLADARRSFTLEPGRPEKIDAGPPLRVREDLDGIRVSNGPGLLRAFIPFAGAAALGRVSRGGRALLRHGAAGTILDKEGRVHRQGAPTVARIEKKGPLHAVVFLAGEYETPGADPVFHYCYRLHFYAGLPLLRLEHSLVNRSAAAGRLARVDLAFAPGFRLDELSFGGDTGRCLRQVTSSRFEIDGRRGGRRHHGWVGAADHLALAAADFWQRFPASLRLEDGALVAGLLDDDSADGMIFAPGEAQTHDLWLWLGPGAPDPAVMTDLVNRRPLLVAPARWMCASGALGKLAPRDARSPGVFDQAIDAGYRKIMETREKRDEYGWRNYGDRRYDAMPRGWLNNEYDWGHTFFLQFARTGDRRWFDLAAASTRHMMDTDIIHYLPPPREHLVGGPHPHSSDHTGAAAVDIGHAWLEGLFDYWAFLGDRRAFEHGTAMADFFARCVDRVDHPRYRGRPGARRPGWGLIGLMGAWRYTLASDWLAAAEKVVEVCLREQVPETGAWVYGGGGLDDPRFMVGKTFMVALTLTGLQRYHEATGDPRAEAALVRGLDWAIDYMWDEQVGGFRYIDAPWDTLGRSPGSSANHILEPLEYAFRLTGNPRYHYVAARTWEAWLAALGERELDPSAICHNVHYQAVHRRPPAYRGEFPLRSVAPVSRACVRGFCALDSENAWAVGLYGLLARTRDGGRRWETVATGRTEHLYGIDFAGRIGCAAGVGPEIMRTADGGESWRSVDTAALAESAYHHDLKLADERTGYLCGNGHIWKTADGGETWRVAWRNREDGRWDKVAKCLSLALLSPERAWVVGSMRLALTVEEGGARIVRRDGLPFGALGVFFVDERTGFAAGPGGGLARTTDGGETWTFLEGLAPGSLWAVAFHRGVVGYAVGEDGVILASEDGGKTWRRCESGFHGQLRAVTVLSADVALAAGDGGVILRTGDRGRTWTPVPVGAPR